MLRLLVCLCAAALASACFSSPAAHDSHGGMKAASDRDYVNYGSDDAARGPGGQTRSDGGPGQIPSTPSIPQGECDNFACRFERGDETCGLTETSGPHPGNTPFILVTNGKFRNSVTGILSGDDGSPGYMATYLTPGANAVLVTRSETPLSEERTIRLRYYEAVEGHVFSACCGSEDDCPFTSEENVDVTTWREWQTAEFTCPKGTDKLVLKCEATGKHQGACGVDSLDIVDESGDSLCNPTLDGYDDYEERLHAASFQ